MTDHGYKPFFGESTAVFIKSLRLRGAATVQIVQDPPPLIQIRRMNPDAGRFEDVGDPIDLIRINFAGSAQGPSGENTGLVSHGALGEMKAFAPVDLQVDDRFEWGGQVCEITHVYPVRNGQVRAVVKLVSGGSGVRT